MCGWTKNWPAESQDNDAFEVWQDLTIFGSTENHDLHFTVLLQYCNERYMYYGKIYKILFDVDKRFQSFFFLSSTTWYNSYPYK